MRCIGTSILDWKLCLPIASHNIAVAAGLMVLRVSGVALHGIEFAALSFGRESLKSGVDDEWVRELFVMVLEGYLVLAFFWHLYPHSGLDDPAALGPVGLQQVFSAIAMKTSLTEVLALPVLAPIVD